MKTGAPDHTTIVKRVMLATAWNAPRQLCLVEVEIDNSKLAMMLGGRAINNKSKRSRLYGGVVKCEVSLIEKEG